MEFLSPMRLTLLCAALPVLACAAGVLFVLVPEPVATASGPVESDAPLPPAIYLPLDAPLRAGVNGGKTQVSMQLAFSARLEPSDLLILSERVKARQAQILATLTDLLLAEAGDIPDPLRLRRDLPAQMRDAINLGLGIEDLPAPVSEVLILDLQVQRV